MFILSLCLTIPFMAIAFLEGINHDQAKECIKKSARNSVRAPFNERF